MKLSKKIITKSSDLADRGYLLPRYDVDKVTRKTLEEPRWVQLGAGNIFRAFLAPHQQQLLNEGVVDTGIIVAEGYDTEIIDVLQRYDNLTINVNLKSDGNLTKEIIGSISKYVKMENDSDDFILLKEIFRKPSLEMVSMTITEKGYSLVDNHGELMPLVKADFENGPYNTQSYLGKLTTLLFERYQAGAFPLALVSMDNMSHNGEKLQNSVFAYVNRWVEKQLVPIDFSEYILNSGKVSFPWTMIDKITPRPDAKIEALLEKEGLEDMSPSQTLKHTFVAPYVNGEETEYLIIEDNFPNGRPLLDKTGIIYTKRETVNKVETMKVTTCLNPLHTALAIFGCLFDYHFIHEEMRDPDLVSLIKVLGYQEGLPVVMNPEIINPEKFIDEVINTRLANPFIPDTPQRIATDTSQKLSVRYGETIKSYVASSTLNAHSLKIIPLVLAGWLRYLSGIKDSGEMFEVSPDPMLPVLQPLFSEFKLGKTNAIQEIETLLRNEKIFGLDLVEVGLSDSIIYLYEEMSKAPGAVRLTIKNVLSEIKSN
ncbi:mannitol dehydrogenase family protein [Enterococcus sp. DIV1314a]|uniref:mannitol dehydrogenase family protein n=1 Tax=Enterococcus sp. DIV1314a TaxID=2774660 RepID=UPI003F2340D4